MKVRREMKSNLLKNREHNIMDVINNSKKVELQSSIGIDLSLIITCRSETDVWIGARRAPVFTDASSYNFLIDGSTLDHPCAAIPGTSDKLDGKDCAATYKFICMTPCK